MHLFYPRYHAQSFYRNTFLVDKPQQIARAEKSDREWNNLAESGCHFTCLAMIAGVDPALLADAAIQTGYYAPDKDLPARALDGKRGPLVWDQNVPSKKGKSWVFRQVWHPDRRALVDIEFSCQRWDDHLPLKTATRLAHAAVLEGRHVVSGSFEHSVLIAGLSADGPLVWDPDMARGSGAAPAAGHGRRRPAAARLGRAREGAQVHRRRVRVAAAPVMVVRRRRCPVEAFVGQIAPKRPCIKRRTLLL